MNRVQRISHRVAWCQLKRLQSSVSTSNSQIQIPIRIKRGPTDILRALANTVPNHTIAVKYPYQDDPYLLPSKKYDYRNFPLSYESGKKTAMWIHKEHRDLFPKYLSDPEIEAFTPLTKYTDKDQVSEEILLNAISRFDISDALHIYKLLGDHTSKQAKQALFELLCFYNDYSNTTINLHYERWFMNHDDKPVWRFMPEIEELYQFLKKQDFATAAAAHNVMICCSARYLRVDKAWLIYRQCIKENIPLNITTYNYMLQLLPEIYDKKSTGKIHHMLNILQTLNNKGIKPNVRTLNAALNVVYMTETDQVKPIVRHLLTEFKRINVKFSLATYYHIINTLVLDTEGHESYREFVNILCAVEEKSFTIEDPDDNLFFLKAMKLANHYTDRNAADIVHNLLMTGNNKQFISNSKIEQVYYFAYMSVLLSTSTISEFFEHYVNIVPYAYAPSRQFFRNLIQHLESCNLQDIMNYLPRLYCDVNQIFTKHIELQFSVLRLMAQFDNIPIDSPLRASFVDAALKCVNNITVAEQTEMPIAADAMGYIAKILVCNGQHEECVSILKKLIKESDKFTPFMSPEQTAQLFNACISEKRTEEALLVLQYCISVEYPYTTKMARKLHVFPEFKNVDCDQLINLLRTKILNTSIER